MQTAIKFSALFGGSAPAIHAELAQLLGEEETPGLSTVKYWAAMFRKGKTEVTNGA